MNRRTGKIARLPHDLRELVNQMLDDGVPYNKILSALNERRALRPPEVTAINKMNLTHWKEGGYQDWCRERDIRRERQVDRQSALDFLKETHGNDLSRALPELSKVQIYQLMMRTDGRDIADGLKNPDSYSKMLNALVRMKKAI